MDIEKRDNQYKTSQFTWESLINIIDHTQNIKMNADILNDEFNILDCISVNYCYKRGFNELQSISSDVSDTPLRKCPKFK
jgi:hypothetical protein